MKNTTVKRQYSSKGSQKAVNKQSDGIWTVVRQQSGNSQQLLGSSQVAVKEQSEGSQEVIWSQSGDSWAAIWWQLGGSWRAV